MNMQEVYTACVTSSVCAFTGQYLFSGSSSSKANAVQATTYAREVPTTKFGTQKADEFSSWHRDEVSAAKETDVTQPAAMSSNHALRRLTTQDAFPRVRRVDMV